MTNVCCFFSRDSRGSFVDDVRGCDLQDRDPLESGEFTIPDLSPSSYYNLDEFSTLLLPQSENLPLETTALNGIRNALLETGSRSLKESFKNRFHEF